MRKYPHTKLKNEDIPKIRELYANGVTQRELAVHFGVNHSTIQSVVERRSWKSV